MDPWWWSEPSPAPERAPTPSRMAHGVVGLLVAALSVAALGRSLPSEEPAAVPAKRAPRAALPAPAAAELRQGRAIDLNRAGPGDLELLPGIGPRLAQRIVEHRARAGAFERVEALTDVRGIGARTLERLRPLVCVEQCDAADAAVDPRADAGTAPHRSSMNTVDTTAAR